ncbi:DUF6660 family protein [Flavobacterium sp. W22_SRS_FK3]|uniref:DUF6660 family protein n=1 Tax=Flavobacterium sp. W22_SRS_FK3 TaxID=3240275 RepID=UPI003F8F53F0
MKFIWFLFSIYLVSLSLMPCNDIDNCSSLAKTELHKNHPQDQKSDSQNDQCTPLCSCACCGTHGFQFQNHFFKKEKDFNFVDAKNLIDFYVYNHYKTIYLGIWQPPKLS